MIYIITACEIEARVLVERLGMQAADDLKFKVYRSQNTILVVGGIGKTASAAATAYLLTDGQVTGEDLCVNVGICGTAGSGEEIGKLEAIGEITDEGSGKKYFAAGPVGGLEKKSITCVDQPMDMNAPGSCPKGLVDMESSGFFRAARCFLPPERISVLKVVSDCFSTEIPAEKFVLTLMLDNAERMCRIILAGADC